MNDYSRCTLCPRECGADRTKSFGFCSCSDEMRVAKIMLHKWEEPCISGKNGSGAVFFCGCVLKCRFCQNRDISRGDISSFRRLSPDELSDEFIRLGENGAHNINLVSPTQYIPSLIETIGKAKEKGLDIPIVWNTGGYEKKESIRMLKGSADIFLTDMKYCDNSLSQSLSSAGDYFEKALPALDEMIDITEENEYGEDGMMKKGVIVRHLVLPGQREDSKKILSFLKERGYEKKIVLSLMSQYIPDFYSGGCGGKLDKDMKRKVTSFEYDDVLSLAGSLGFTGFCQDRTSAVSRFVPEWDMYEKE